MDAAALTATDAARLIRERKLGSVELVTALLARIERFAGLNAFTALDPAAALAAAAAADGPGARAGRLRPLHGVPITLKDNIACVGLPNSAGTPALRAHRPTRDAAVVERLVAAGALPFGKNGMHELALGVTSNNAGFGPSRNPFAPDRIPGGSSGGTAVAVAAGLAPAGIGTDTGGSVRIPAALCGLYGFRPTTGRWPAAGIVPISATRDTPGPLARSVEDLVALDAVVAGETQALAARPLAGLRLGVVDPFWDELEPAVDRLAQDGLRRLTQAGVTLVAVDLSEIGRRAPEIGFVIALFELMRDLGPFLAEAGATVGAAALAARVASPDVRAVLASMLAAETAIDPAAYGAAIAVERPQLRAAYAACFAAHRLDGLVFPTVPVSAPPIGRDVTIWLNGAEQPTFHTIIRNTDPGSCAGLPGLTLPIGLTESGLPVGLGIDAAIGQDRALLALGLGLQPLFPWTPPPLN